MIPSVTSRTAKDIRARAVTAARANWIAMRMRISFLWEPQIDAAVKRIEAAVRDPGRDLLSKRRVRHQQGLGSHHHCHANVATDSRWFVDKAPAPSTCAALLGHASERRVDVLSQARDVVLQVVRLHRGVADPVLDIGR